MDCRVKPGNDEGFACLMACKKYGCRLLTGLPNPAVIIVTNDGTTTRERDRAELVLDYTLGSGLRSKFFDFCHQLPPNLPPSLNLKVISEDLNNLSELKPAAEASGVNQHRGANADLLAGDSGNEHTARSSFHSGVLSHSVGGDRRRAS